MENMTKTKTKSTKISSIAVTIDGQPYRCVRSHSCRGCAFVNECYSIPRKKRCPTFGRQDIALALNVIYKRIDPNDGLYYVITDADGAYYQGGNLITDFATNATLFKSEHAAETVRQDIEQRLKCGRLTVVPVNINNTVKGVQ